MVVTSLILYNKVSIICSCVILFFGSYQSLSLSIVFHRINTIYLTKAIAKILEILKSLTIFLVEVQVVRPATREVAKRPVT